MLPYAGYVDPESTLAIGVHHDGHLEATELTFCSLYHTFMFGFTPFAVVPSENLRDQQELLRVKRKTFLKWIIRLVRSQRCFSITRPLRRRPPIGSGSRRVWMAHGVLSLWAARARHRQHRVAAAAHSSLSEQVSARCPPSRSSRRVQRWTWR